MSFWAGIKHALNSTLGTSNFKPLDAIIKEQINGAVDELTSEITSGQTRVISDIGNTVVAQTRIVASDDAYATIAGGSVETKPVNTEVSYILPKKLKMTRPGSIRISGTLSRTNSSKMRGGLAVLVNGVEAERYYRSDEVGTNSDEFSMDVSFSAGDIISFKVYGTNTASTTDTRKVSVSEMVLTGKVINNVHEVVQ